MSKAQEYAANKQPYFIPNHRGEVANGCDFMVNEDGNLEMRADPDLTVQCHHDAVPNLIKWLERIFLDHPKPAQD